MEEMFAKIVTKIAKLREDVSKEIFTQNKKYPQKSKIFLKRILDIV